MARQPALHFPLQLTNGLFKRTRDFLNLALGQLIEERECDHAICNRFGISQTVGLARCKAVKLQNWLSMQRRKIPSRGDSLIQKRLANPVAMLRVELRRYLHRIYEPADSAQPTVQRRSNNFRYRRQRPLISLCQPLPSRDHGFNSRQLRDSQRTTDVGKSVAEARLDVLIQTERMIASLIS